MKSLLPLALSIRRRSITRLLALALAFLGPAAHANPELDRLYALETVGALKAWDNVDGLFTDYVTNAYKDYFSRQTRFVYQDLSKADSVLKSSKLPYGKLIEDTQILAQIARSEKTQTILRTKISKQGAQYRFTIDWMHAPRMDLLATDTFILDGSADGGLSNVQDVLEKALARLFGKLPFLGNVTGRDENSVTVNLGATSGLQKGDVLVTGTLDDVKKHPLLKTIVDWRFSETGKVEVESVDEALAFARVIEEEPGRQVARYQKVLSVQPKPYKKEETIVDESKEQARKQAEEPPRNGWGEGALWVGSFNREYTTGSGGKNGSGFFFGAKTDGQVWWTPQVFSEMGFGYGFANYSQTDLVSGATPGTGSIGTSSTMSSIFRFNIDTGFTYLVNGPGDIFGPKGWVKFGYHSTVYSLPSTSVASGDLLEPIVFKSFYLGIGGDLPVRQGFGFNVNLDFGIFNSGTEEGPSPHNVESARDVTFFVGMYYRKTNRISFRLGVEVLANGADLSGGASLTHKLVSVTPGVIFYF